MPTVTIEQLKTLIMKKFITVGVPEKDAKIVAEVLAFAEMRGISTHGVMRLEHYINRIQHNSIKANPTIKKTSINDVIVKVDGDAGLGHIVAKIAIDEAAERAKQFGIGLSIINNTSHSGAIGYYVHEVAQQNLIGIAFTQADPLVAPFGGRKAMLGANPIAYGVPTKIGYPLVLDMSTSEVSFGKVMIARENNEEIPTTWGLNEAGEPTSNPHEVKALQSMAGAKGYGLAMLVDILAGVLAGVPFGQHIEPMYGNLSAPRNLGQLFIVLNPEHFVGTKYFIEQIQQMVDELHESPKAPNVEKIYVPGERSYENVKRAEQHGIELTEAYYHFLMEGE